MSDNASVQRLVLASKSPIRSALLRDAGLLFETAPAAVDEAVLIAKNQGSAPGDIAARLAAAKAETIGQNRPGDLVIGADQLLIAKGEILQKPEDMSAARHRLMQLAGTSHNLVTGVALARGGYTIWRHVETATLTMHVLSAADIEQSLALEGEAVLQSVGAYRLEGPGITLFAALEGDYFAMLGLPLVPLLCALRRHAGHLLPGAASA